MLPAGIPDQEATGRPTGSLQLPTATSRRKEGQCERSTPVNNQIRTNTIQRITKAEDSVARDSEQEFEFLLNSSKTPADQENRGHLDPKLLQAVNINHEPKTDNVVFRVAWDWATEVTTPLSHAVDGLRSGADFQFESFLDRVLELHTWRQFEFKKQNKVQAEYALSGHGCSVEESTTEVREFENPQYQKLEVVIYKATESKEASVIFQRYMEGYNQEEINYLTAALQGSVPFLISHAFGSYIIQKLCLLSPSFKQVVIDYCLHNMMNLSSNEYSSRVMQVLAENIPAFRLKLFRDAADNFTVAMRSMSWVLLLNACVRAAQSSQEYEELLVKMCQNPQQRTDSKTYYFKLVVSIVRVCSPEALSQLYHAFRPIMTCPSLFSSKNRLLILSSILNRKHSLAIKDFEKTLYRLQNHHVVVESPHVTYFIDKLNRGESSAEYDSSPLAILHDWLKSLQNRVLKGRSLGSVLDPRGVGMRYLDRSVHFYSYLAALTSPPRMFARLQVMRQARPPGFPNSGKY